jgi:hypothetical protein
MSRRRVSGFRLVAGLVASLWSACGDDADDNGGPSIDASIDAGDAGSMAGDAKGELGDAEVAPPDSPITKLYAVLSTISGDTNSSSYVSLVPSLAEGEVRNLEKSVELSGARYMFGVDGKPSLYVLDDSASLTRYDLSEDNTLVKGPVLSFAAYGVTTGSTEGSVFFVSDTKAYLLDDVSLQAVIWDPSKMLASKSIDLSGLRRDMWTTYFDYLPKRRGDQLVLAAYYLDESFSTSLREVTAAIIDLNTDQARLLSDKRCGGFSTSVLTNAGDIYFASDPYLGALHRLGGEAASPAGCILRIVNGQEVFDPSYFAEVTSLAAGFGGGIVPGPGNSAFLRIYNEQIVPIGPSTSAFDVYANASWQFWRIELGSSQRGTPTTLAPGAGTVRVFNLDGRSYATNAGADYSTTSLVDMSQPEGPREGVRVPGIVAGLVRVR